MLDGYRQQANNVTPQLSCAFGKWLLRSLITLRRPFDSTRAVVDGLTSMT